MPRAPVHVYKVDDRPCDDAIDQITCGTADDEREAYASDELMPREARRVNTYADHRCRCDHRDDDRLEREVDTLQKAVRDARIRHVCEVHEPWNDCPARIERQLRANHCLCDLIDDHDENWQPDLDPSRQMR